MNHLLLYPDELSVREAGASCSEATVVLEPSAESSEARKLRSEERLRHLRKVLRVEVGTRIRVGVLGDGVGLAEVLRVDRAGAVLRVGDLEAPPPAPRDVHLVLALPRPKFLGRILQMVSTCGVRRLTLIGSARVEASFWCSSAIAPESVERHLVLGLEQGRGTRLPEVALQQSFEETTRLVAAEVEKGPVLLAHGATARRMPTVFSSRTVTLLVGPEGGWLDGEVGRLLRTGAQCRSLGRSALRVETAVAALLARVAL